ncbi:MAG: alanine dehydrogenase [Thermodesulfobacteriota bacterium]
MIIGIPKEIKEEELRVAITPAGVSAFVAHGHKVLIEKGAGMGSGILDKEYRKAGATIINASDVIWERGDMILKVKEPLKSEYSLIREDQIVFTYFHLAANEPLTHSLIESNAVAVAYETIQLDDGSLPLLAPMSEVAGRLSIQVGAQCLEAKNGGRGILLSGVSGVAPAKVVIIGAGIVGINACHVASGIGAHVSILDINPTRLAYVRDIMKGNVTTIMSNRANIEEEVLGADLVVGGVLIPGAKTPRLVTKGMVRRMKKGSVIVDIAVDQGGLFETTRPTTHDNPTYIIYGVVHYCVTNMPGAVPRTSTYALTNSTLSYALAIADQGLERSMAHNSALKKGLNVYKGKVTLRAVAESFGLDYEDAQF